MPNDLMPDEVVVSSDRRDMTISWADGTNARLSARTLRTACRCAWCTRDRILGGFAADRHGLTLASLDALGSHGLHLKFSDGHARGIFPWAYLRDLAGGATPIGVNAEHAVCLTP